MSVIEKARELGKALQESAEYQQYIEAKRVNDTDVDLQNMIGEFNMLRMQLNQEMSKEEKNSDEMKRLDGEIKTLYGKIMSNKSMAEYNACTEKMEKIMNSVNYIISQAANGEDPMTCPETAPSCTGSCSTCGGCH
ncbi:MAG: YlbF family regulator [Ruminococcus sp.]|nr:YlbF family regulator [Ruminococcus sp.]MCD7727898.1 YlbF family regulator [Ruminococcus sp.]MCD7773437.1 YlbF family regulator [Ruminococcus sp.]